MKTIYLAGGCFWGVEKYFSLVKGVLSTKVGYANGTKEKPSYEDLKKGRDDASECVEVIYDEKVISLEKLLELYLRVVDPYSLNKQGEDEGIQYRSGIYYLNEIDKEKILKYFKEINLQNHQIEILPLKSFYDAEEYHQKYLDKNPNGYCHINFAKLKEDERK